MGIVEVGRADSRNARVQHCAGIVGESDIVNQAGVYRKQKLDTRERFLWLSSRPENKALALNITSPQDSSVKILFLLPVQYLTKMEFYPTKQEVAIIQVASIIWTSWDLYRDWDRYSKRLIAIYNRFTSDPDENNARPRPNRAPR